MDGLPHEAAGDAPAADASFDIVAPGFIDLQINGAGGVLFNDAPDTDSIARMVAAARRGGTCHLLPTYITAAGTGYADALAAVAAWQGPEVLGIHLEGPFLSLARPGIHPPAHIRPMAEDDLALLLGHHGLLLLTLAPEEVGETQIARLAAGGVVLFAANLESCDVAAKGRHGVGDEAQPSLHQLMRHAQIVRRDMVAVGDNAGGKPRIAKGRPDHAGITRADL